MAAALAVGRESATHFFSGVGPAMQPKAVAILLGRKTVVEDSGEVLRLNPDTIVDDADLDPVGGGHSYTDDQPPGAVGLVVHGILGVAEEINENLQHLVPVHT